MLTAPLCRAARALTEISRDTLARRASVAATAIEAFERRISTPDEPTLGRLKSALEEFGAVFIPEDGRGAGVRLKFTESERKRLATLEGEGGIVAADDVP